MVRYYRDSDMPPDLDLGLPAARSFLNAAPVAFPTAPPSSQPSFVPQQPYQPQYTAPQQQPSASIDVGDLSPLLS